MRALITGGAGFIGSHLSERLLNEGVEVLVIDDLSTGSKENIQHLEKFSSFVFREGSILDKEFLREAIDESDVIYHLAAAVGVKNIMENRLKSILTNVRGTDLILEFASEKKQKVLIASSSEVYGKNDQRPYSEDSDSVFGPTTIHRWSYGAAKAVDEFLAHAYYKERDLPVVISRFFNTCGARQTEQYGMVLPTFVKAALHNDTVCIHGDGEQSRVFVDVSDAVDAVMLIMNNSAAVGEVFNIGGQDEITINELAHRVISITKSSSKTIHIPYKKVFKTGFEDMLKRVPDLHKIKEFTGWEPKIRIDEIISSVSERYMKMHNV
ncbi:MAG: GDP-mannose 4,6-dehydratase [Calditrichaeota bacterium]|nr:GDP-mannose 4,6-dehydratase [Calditrichota bacterium]